MCLIENCNNSKYKNDVCRKHYTQKLEAGEFGKYIPRQNWRGTVCQIDNCTAPIHAKGYCSTHYSRVLRHGDVDTVLRFPKYVGTCALVYSDGNKCDRRVSAKTFCRKHYQALMRHGDPLADKSRKLNSGNYVSIFAPGHPNANKAGRILEHRYVMSESLGRALFPDENVHHKNGNRHDNRLENLELWSTVQPAGQRVEDKLEWAVLIVKRYMNLDLLD